MKIIVTVGDIVKTAHVNVFKVLLEIVVIKKHPDHILINFKLYIKIIKLIKINENILNFFNYFLY